MLLQNTFIRIHRLRYQDCEIVNAVFDEDLQLCNIVRAKPALFTQLLEHIHQSAEIAIDASAASFQLRSAPPSTTALAKAKATSQLLKPKMLTGLLC